MNGLRNKVLIAGACLALLALALPPWQFAHPMMARATGYRPIFSPPANSKIDTTRLALELLAIGLLGFVVLKVMEK